MIANHPEREQIRLENVLSALGNPLRLEIIRTLADGSELSCNALRQEEVAKSTMTHHWRVLRDSGVIWQRPQGREASTEPFCGWSRGSRQVHKSSALVR